MKKNLSIFAAALILTVSLASCGKDSLDNEEIKKPEPPSTMTTTVTTTTTTTTTTKATTKKTTKATTTTARTTETTTKTSKTDSASPIGKWKVSGDEDNEIAEYLADTSGEVNLSDLVFEFDNEYCKLQVESDISSMMCLTDEGFKFYDITYKDIKYDGSVLTLNADGETIDFKRCGSPDPNSKYGKYTCDELEEDEFEDDEFNSYEYFFDFRSPEEAYMIAEFSLKYTYDAEKKTMNLMGQNDIGIEFEGNKMIMKSSDGSRSVFERAD